MNFINEQIENYAIAKSSRPSSAARGLADQTRKLESMSMMLVGEMEGSFLGFLIRMGKMRRVLEIGTFTGYSALVMAENLPDAGEVHTVDIESRSYTEEHWRKSLHRKKITQHLGKGIDIIPKLEGSFDLIFIDADKTGYEDYLHLGLEKLSANGIIVVDNVLWSGRVLNSDKEIENDKDSLAIKKFNNLVSSRSDLYGTLLPIRDGIFLITKK